MFWNSKCYAQSHVLAESVAWDVIDRLEADPAESVVEEVLGVTQNVLSRI